MARFVVLLCFVTAAVLGALLPAPGNAQSAAPLAGLWTLNRSLSEFPREMAFTPDWVVRPGGDGQSAGPTTGGRGRRGSGSGGSSRGSASPSPILRESYEDAQRVQLLTAEARNPPVRLMIVDTAAAVTITNELGQSRTLHPNGKEESIEIQGMPILATTKRDGDRLVVLYRAEQDREVRYTYSPSANPSQLGVEVQLVQRGAGDKVRRVYEPGVEPAPLASAGPAQTPPSSNQQTRESLDQRPGAELRGLKNLGILVEDLSAQAVACGLNHDIIENALSKRLRDSGFAVRTNSDEDTYVYVNVMSTGGSNGTCVSRYDAFLYTHATARLSYRDQPVLVQVSLAHRGGIGSSAPTGHAAAVVRALESYVDLFTTEIHDANK